MADIPPRERGRRDAIAAIEYKARRGFDADMATGKYTYAQAHARNPGMSAADLEARKPKDTFKGVMVTPPAESGLKPYYAMSNEVSRLTTPVRVPLPPTTPDSFSTKTNQFGRVVQVSGKTGRESDYPGQLPPTPIPYRTVTEQRPASSTQQYPTTISQRMPVPPPAPAPASSSDSFVPAPQSIDTFTPPSPTPAPPWLSFGGPTSPPQVPASQPSDTSTLPAPTPEPTPQPQPAQSPTVSSKEEFDALDSGTLYIGKDGRQYRKP